MVSRRTVFGKHRFGEQGRLFQRLRLTAARRAAHRFDTHLPDVRGVDRQLRQDQVMQHARKVPAAGAGDDLADVGEQV
ncbi:hypothetical protein D3C81_1404230 [compost metagenome]